MDLKKVWKGVALAFIIKSSAYFVLWTTALCMYIPQRNNLSTAAVINMFVHLLVVLNFSTTKIQFVKRIYTVYEDICPMFSIFLYVLTFNWFKEAVGESAFEMVSKHGPLYFMNYPLLFQVVYIELFSLMATALFLFLLILIFGLTLSQHSELHADLLFLMLFPARFQAMQEDEERLCVSNAVPEDYLEKVFMKCAPSNSEEVCSICLCEFDEETLESITCHHQFHKSCIHEWINSKNQLNRHCPMCKAAFEPPMIVCVA